MKVQTDKAIRDSFGMTVRNGAAGKLMMCIVLQGRNCLGGYCLYNRDVTLMDIFCRVLGDFSQK